MADDVAVDYLNKSLTWYDSRSQINRWAYLSMKVTQIVLAAAIPILSPMQIPREAIAVMGGTIGIVEGILQLGQFHQNWIRYRSTCEALRSEQFLFNSQAGPYAKTAEDRHALLAERANALVSNENSKWQALRETTTAKDKQA